MELITCNQTQKDSIMTFDTICTSPIIQRLKILIPFISPSMQGTFAFYIKLLELKYTLQLFKNHKGLLFHNIHPNVNQICDELSPYLSYQEQNNLNSMKNMYQKFNDMKDMMDMINTIKDMFPEGFDIGDMSSMGNMMGMGDMDNIMNIMNQFGGMNNNGTDT